MTVTSPVTSAMQPPLDVVTTAGRFLEIVISKTIPNDLDGRYTPHLTYTRLYLPRLLLFPLQFISDLRHCSTSPYYSGILFQSISILLICNASLALVT